MIPPFDHNLVLPPHLGDPTNMQHLSPYYCTSLELARRFSFNPIRIQLLKNLFIFRQGLRNAGLQGNCFQWIDGSFVENKEQICNESPGDIDVVTFYHGYDNVMAAQIVQNFPAFNDRAVARDTFLLDHFPVNLQRGPLFAYTYVKYWTMLFNHSRLGVWKGILLLEVNTPADDEEALVYLNGL